MQRREEESILAYQKIHAGAMPKLPLKTMLARKFCRCLLTNIPRTNLYEKPPEKKKAKKRRKSSVAQSPKGKRASGGTSRGPSSRAAPKQQLKKSGF